MGLHFSYIILCLYPPFFQSTPPQKGIEETGGGSTSMKMNLHAGGNREMWGLGSLGGSRVIYWGAQPQPPPAR